MKKASEYVIYLMAVLIPTVIVPHFLLHPFDLPKVLALLAGVGLLVIFDPEPLRRLPGPVVLLIALNAISLIYTKNLEFTVHFGALNVATLLLVIYTGEHINTAKKARRLFACICLGGVVASTFALLQYQGIHVFTGKLAVPIGTVGNGNFFGTYLLFPMAAVAGLFLMVESKKVKYGLLLVGIFFFSAFILARCRSSWLAFGITVIPFIWFVATKKDWATGICFVMMVILVVAATIFPKSHLNWTETKTLNERWKYWQAAAYLIENNPVYGHGIESFRNLVYQAQAKVGQKDPNYWSDFIEPKPRHVHNQYLEILVDGGIIAAGLLLWLLWFYLKPAWVVMRNCTGDKRFILGTAFFAIMATLVSMVFYFPLKESTSLCMIGLMLGVIAGFVRHSEPTREKTHWATRAAVAVFVVIISFHVAIRPAISSYHIKKSMDASLVGNNDLAIENTLRAIHYSPDSSEHWQQLGLLMLFGKKDPAAAKDFFERALLPFNGNIVQWAPHYWIAMSDIMLNRGNEAITSLETTLYYWPAHKDAAMLLNRLHQIARAKENK